MPGDPSHPELSFEHTFTGFGYLTILRNMGLAVEPTWSTVPWAPDLPRPTHGAQRHQKERSVTRVRTRDRKKTACSRQEESLGLTTESQDQNTEACQTYSLCYTHLAVGLNKRSESSAANKDRVSKTDHPCLLSAHLTPPLPPFPCSPYAAPFQANHERSRCRSIPQRNRSAAGSGKRATSRRILWQADSVRKSRPDCPTQQILQERLGQSAKRADKAIV